MGNFSTKEQPDLLANEAERRRNIKESIKSLPDSAKEIIRKIVVLHTDHLRRLQDVVREFDNLDEATREAVYKVMKDEGLLLINILVFNSEFVSSASSDPNPLLSLFFRVGNTNLLSAASSISQLTPDAAYELIDTIFSAETILHGPMVQNLGLRIITRISNILLTINSVAEKFNEMIDMIRFGLSGPQEPPDPKEVS